MQEIYSSLENLKAENLTVNIEEFPDSNDASVDFPTPLPPTIDTNESWVLKSGISIKSLSLSLASSKKKPSNLEESLY